MLNIPKTAKLKVTDAHRRVLAYGEVTGHAHAFYGEKSSDLFEDVQDNQTLTFLRVNECDDLRHEEHTKMPFDAGFEGIVRIQRQYQQGEIRRVLD